MYAFVRVNVLFSANVEVGSPPPRISARRQPLRSTEKSESRSKSKSRKLTFESTHANRTYMIHQLQLT